jgi:hypothetical protein
MKLKIEEPRYNKTRFNLTSCCSYLLGEFEIDTRLWLNTLTIYRR